VPDSIRSRTFLPDCLPLRECPSRLNDLRDEEDLEEERCNLEGEEDKYWCSRSEDSYEDVYEEEEPNFPSRFPSFIVGNGALGVEFWINRPRENVPVNLAVSRRGLVILGDTSGSIRRPLAPRLTSFDANWRPPRARGSLAGFDMDGSVLASAFINEVCSN